MTTAIVSNPSYIDNSGYNYIPLTTSTPSTISNAYGGYGLGANVANILWGSEPTYNNAAWNISPTVTAPTTTNDNLIAVNSITPTAVVGDVIAGKNSWWGNTKNFFNSKLPNTTAGLSADVAKAREIGGQYATGFKGMTTAQKANTLLEGVGQVMNALNARKQTKLAKQSLNHTIANDNRNFEIARRNYNSQLEDRQRYREAYWKANNAGNLDNKPVSVNEYLNKYGA